MNSKHRKTLAALFSGKSPKNMAFRDIESLLRALGCSINEAEGSRIEFIREEKSWTTHRPHPSKQAREYHIQQVRVFLKKLGVEE